MALFGRHRELDRIHSVIRGPKEAVLSVVGRKGAGKTALLSEIPTLSDYRTVFLAASAAESDWPYSGLTALLNDMDDPVLNRLLDELLGDIGAMSTQTVSSMLLNGLHQRSSSRTIVVIDDAHHLDPGSQAVIGFMARRLAGTDIVLIVSVREDLPESPFSGLSALRLGPLDFSDTVRMLESIPAKRTTTAAPHAVASASRGNPLAAIGLYDRLLERHAEGIYALPVPLPSGGSFDAEYASALNALTPAARNILDLLALSFRSDISTIEKIDRDVWTVIDELLAAGLVTRRGSHLWIGDQLLRGYVFMAMAPAVRMANHHVLAEAASDTDPNACRWHVSFTALEQQTPFQLLQHALELVHGGEVSFAVEYIERALTISPCEAETAARLTSLAELLFNRGEFVYARRYLEWAQRITRNPGLILRLTGLSFEIQFAQGAAVRSSMVLRLVQEFGHHDPAYAARLLAIGAIYYTERWELQEASELLGHLSELRSSASAQCLGIADRAKLLIESIGGDTVSRGRQQERTGTARIVGLLMQGRTHTYAEHYESAHEAFALLNSFDEPGHVNWQRTAAYMAVDNAIRAGNVRAAVRMIDELELSDPELKYHRGTRHLFRVWRAHSLGDDAQANAYAAEALRYGGADSHPAITAQLAAYQGHFALLRGDLAESAAQLSRAAEIGMRFGNPTLLRCEADLVEVLIRLGRHHEATQALLRLESRSVGLRSPWLMMAVARSRALLADGEQSLQLFSEALQNRNGHSLERARILMCYAERLHAFGRLRDARDALLRAKVMFDEVGANAWAQHVDALLLDERMEPARPKGNPAMLVLADHEQALAKMVARGMRNKEIAATLYVSVRTVEVRLTAIYRKLGVESRAQLTALAAGKGTGATEPYLLPVL
ncbi:DNA-binding CsgD family transcriptional regulator [Pseudarthrobacter defluvii]|uniref:DNA-binding CsgD family transcriptional regulator n=1 Tax=Pseudarthrobacter defluvii TaxID=410837 RepID=A0ABT9UI35_9MICC|nr:LuxR family transcriptional regulator [Pseudarthrobacter defluvii]MDQ0119281.1 DNA-binding CsgD family transcriptional regulator [Pseudarthrobacter defluvii]